LTDILSDVVSVELPSVKFAFLLAAIVSPRLPLSVSDPLPVQPLTVNVLPPVASLTLAVVKPLSVRLAPPAAAAHARARTFSSVWSRSKATGAS
jgi:hypothetical protein